MSMTFACFWTMFVYYFSLNTLHLDPLPSCLRVVHDRRLCQKMNPAVKMMFLRQGTRSIEDYVVDSLELAHMTHLDEICLMIFFRGGLSEPLSSIIQLHDPIWTLENYCILTCITAEWLSFYPAE